MKLGTNIPRDTVFHVHGRFSMDAALNAMAQEGIRGCLNNFVDEPSEWKHEAETFATSLEKAGMELLEYNAPMFLQPASRNDCERLADAYVKMLSIADSIGCLNVGTCTGGFSGILPDPRNRGPEAWELLKETCSLIAESAARKDLNGRVMLELVYTSTVWSPKVMARFLDEVDSPHICGHIDVVNCLTFDTVFDPADVIREAFDLLGNRSHSAHLKDVAPRNDYLPGTEERQVGEGIMDFRTYLSHLSELPSEFPALIEHVPDFETLKRSYRRIKAMADEMNIPVWGKGAHQ